MKMTIKNGQQSALATGEFSSEDQALERFAQEFKPHLNEAKKRIIFLETTDGQTAGTATAWYGEWNSEIIGRLHWIEILPEFQGLRLGRPLVAEAMRLLALYHNHAYLKTQITSRAAIHIYKKLGFKPVILHEEEREVWEHINE
ncbi:N-acetyltransferase [Virgibacillus profundi]|nr:N-acetyltransferase [Virgibacillus profundi]